MAGSADQRVGMHRKQHVDVTAVGDVADRAADLGERRADVLAAVRGDEDETAAVPWRVDRGLDPIRGPQQGVHDGVARDAHVVPRDALGDQLLGGPSGRSEVELGEPADELSVHLLGNGDRRRPVRSPASRCATGTPR